MAAGDLELARLVLELPEHARVVDGDRRLARERFEQLGGASGERAGHPSPHEDRADDLALPEQRHDEHRAPAEVRELCDVRVARFGEQVGCGQRLTARGRASHEGLVEVDPGSPQGLDELRLGAEARADLEELRLRVELHDRPTLGAGQLHGAGDDRRQDLVDVEARRDRLADLPERAELVDRARQLLQELHVAQRDRGLRRERGEQVDRAGAERVHRGAPEGQDTRDAVAGEDRHAQDRPEPAELAAGMPVVVGIRQDVWDLDDAALALDPAHQRARALLDRMAAHVVPIGLGGTDHECQAEHIVVQLMHETGIGSAESHGLPYDGLEQRLELEVRAPHELEHLARRGLLLDRLGQFALEPSDAVGVRPQRLRLS